jgi:hypothetical protein
LKGEAAKMRNYRKISIVLAVLLFAFATSSLVRAAGPSINLPPGHISVQVSYPSSSSYYDVILSSVPSGYHVTDGTYVGWCVDEYHNIYNGRTYSGILYSSYDPSNPQADPDWDKVNYILNNKEGNWRDVQEAIWYFVDGGHTPSTAHGQAMVNNAIAYGQGFVPIPGQILAVVVWIDCRTQIPIIEVVVPLQNVVPEYPLGPILGVTTFLAALGVFKYKHAIPDIFKFKFF